MEQKTRMFDTAFFFVIEIKVPFTSERKKKLAETQVVTLHVPTLMITLCYRGGSRIFKGWGRGTLSKGGSEIQKR